MSRRVLVLAVCGIVLASVAVPTAAVPSKYVASDTYRHVWQAQSLFSGDAGQFDQRVIDSEFEFRRDADAYAAVLRYHDVIAILDGSGTVFSQEALIDIALEGSALSETRAGGTFSGTATLTGRNTTSLQDALGPPARTGEVTAYDVTGHWGAEVGPDIAEGEIIYETALPVGSTGVVRDVVWFNRSSFANPDQLGEPQTFKTSITDADVHSIDGDDDADYTAGSGEDSDAATGVDGGSDGQGSSAGTQRGGVLAFIRKGLGGGRDHTFGWAAHDSVIAAQALRDARPSGASPLPGNAVSIDIEYSGAYLDAKNRAAGMLGSDGPLFEGAAALTDALTGMRRSAPGIPALPPDVDAGQFWAHWALQAIRTHADVAGVPELISELELVAPGLDPDGVFAVRSTAMSALAAFRAPFGSVLEGVASCAHDVATRALADGAGSDAVLAAARDPRAPESATVVTAFERDESLDLDKDSTPPNGTVLNREAVIGVGDAAVFGWTTSGVKGGNISAEAWLGYVRADGTMYWLAKGKDAATTEGSLLGWAYSTRGRSLVDANDVGQVIAHAPDADWSH